MHEVLLRHEADGAAEAVWLRDAVGTHDAAARQRHVAHEAAEEHALAAAAGPHHRRQLRAPEAARRAVQQPPPRRQRHVESLKRDLGAVAPPAAAGTAVAGVPVVGRAHAPRRLVTTRWLLLLLLLGIDIADARALARAPVGGVGGARGAEPAGNGAADGEEGGAREEHERRLQRRRFGGGALGAVREESARHRHHRRRAADVAGGARPLLRWVGAEVARRARRAHHRARRAVRAHLAPPPLRRPCAHEARGAELLRPRARRAVRGRLEREAAPHRRRHRRRRAVGGDGASQLGVGARVAAAAAVAQHAERVLRLRAAHDRIARVGGGAPLQIGLEGKLPPPLPLPLPLPLVRLDTGGGSAADATERAPLTAVAPPEGPTRAGPCVVVVVVVVAVAVVVVFACRD